MEVVNSHAANPGAEIANGRRPVDAERPKDGPHGPSAPEPKSRGAAVVFGGSLGNLDAGSRTRDAERQSKIDRHAAQHERMDARREEAHQRMVARREARHEVDVSA